jgi:peptidylprolyl isomerase
MKREEGTMTKARLGDTVKACYVGKLDNGQVFDQSHARDPLEFTIGEQQVHRGLEEAVSGMAPGESKTTVVPAERAYGPVRPDRIVTVDRDDVPDHIELSVGKRLRAPTTHGTKIDITVKDVTDTNVTFDANHPLAGEDLTFEVRLVDIANEVRREEKVHA